MSFSITWKNAFIILIGEQSEAELPGKTSWEKETGLGSMLLTFACLNAAALPSLASAMLKAYIFLKNW